MCSRIFKYSKCAAKYENDQNIAKGKLAFEMIKVQNIVL